MLVIDNSFVQLHLATQVKLGLSIKTQSVPMSSLYYCTICHLLLSLYHNGGNGGQAMAYFTLLGPMSLAPAPSSSFTISE